MKNILTKKFYLSIDLAGRLESDHFIRGSYKEPRPPDSLDVVGTCIHDLDL